MNIKIIKKIALVILLLAPALLFISKNFAVVASSFASSMRSLEAKLRMKQFGAIEYVLEGQKTVKEKKGKDVGANRLKIEKLEEEITQIKQEVGIQRIEDKMAEKREGLLELAANVYAKAVPESGPYAGQNLYVVIQKLIKSSRDRIKGDLEQIIRLKQKIAKAIDTEVDKIQKIGAQIENRTKEEQKNLAGLLSEIADLKQERDKKLLSPGIDARIDPLREKIRALEKKIEQSISELVPSDQQKIRQLQNEKANIRLMIRLIEDPDTIAHLISDDIVGT